MASPPHLLASPLTADDHTLGPADAPLTLVEYADFQCPHCAAARATVATIRETLGDALRYAFRHFPLSQVHPAARAAAEASEFAAANGKFWEMNALLFERHAALSPTEIESLARQIGLDVVALRNALQSAQFRQRVQQDIAGAVRSGVTGTPSYFINRIKYTRSIKTAELLNALEEARRGAVV